VRRNGPRSVRATRRRRREGPEKKRKVSSASTADEPADHAWAAGEGHKGGFGVEREFHGKVTGTAGCWHSSVRDDRESRGRASPTRNRRKPIAVIAQGGRRRGVSGADEKSATAVTSPAARRGDKAIAAAQRLRDWLADEGHRGGAGR